MKELFIGLWEFKWLLFSYGLFLWSDDDCDKIICAMCVGFFGLELKMETLFEKYFGKRK